MAGRRLLDVAALLNASRGIAQRHVALRQQQLDVFLRSSSLAKAVKTQAERYTETAKAASILAARMNEDRPAWTYEATDTPPQQTKETVVPSPEATATEPAPKIPREGLEQDHFYEPSKANGAAEPLPKDELPINGAKPDAVPTPDGSIPPTDTKAGIPLKHHHASHEYKLSSTEARTLQREYENQIPSKAADGEEGHKGDSIVKGMDDDSFYHPSEHISPTLSSLPRVKLPKHTNAEQGDDVHVANKDIHPDTYTAPTTSKEVAGEETLPEGINTAIFHSRRVAQSLGGRIITDAFQDGTQRETKPHPLAPKPHPLAPKPAKSEPIVENPAAESTIPVPEFEPTPATVDATPSVPVSEVSPRQKLSNQNDS